MPQARLSMRKTREVLRLRLDRRRTQQEVATACNISPSTVWDTMRRFKASGLTWPLLDSVSDNELEARLYPSESPADQGEKPVPDWPALHAERKLAKNVTLTLLWEEYKRDHPDGYEYSWFCQAYRDWVKTIDPVMRQTYRFGEKCLVDYVGETVSVVDPVTGNVTEAQIFVGTLGASNYTFAEAQPGQDLFSWTLGHVRMFEYFGGVPEVLIPDNLKSGVKKASFYDPEINPTYLALAEHYETAVIPARARKPRDKAKAENAVLQVERRIIAPLRNRTFCSIRELNDAISELLDDLNERPFQKLEGCRREIYERDERPLMSPLPAQAFVFVHRKDAKVGPDYHVQYDHHFYSVPYGLAGQPVEVFASAKLIEIVHGGQRIASHLRSRHRGGFTTDDAHRHPHHRRELEWTPERLQTWARKLGPNVALMVTGILHARQHPEQGFRRCLGLLKLEKKHTAQRLDTACERAVSAGAFSYQSVKSILEKKLDQQPATVAPNTNGSRRLHENVRGPEYYD